MVTERDKSLRLAVLDTLEILYKMEGEAAVWGQVGSLNGQQKSLIEERFKTVDKQAARLQTQQRLENQENAAEHSESPSYAGIQTPRWLSETPKSPFLHLWVFGPSFFMASRYRVFLKSFN